MTKRTKKKHKFERIRPALKSKNLLLKAKLMKAEKLKKWMHHRAAGMITIIASGLRAAIKGTFNAYTRLKVFDVAWQRPSKFINVKNTSILLLLLPILQTL